MELFADRAFRRTIMFLKIIIGYLLIVIYLTMVATGAEIYEKRAIRKARALICV